MARGAKIPEGQCRVLTYKNGNKVIICKVGNKVVFKGPYRENEVTISTVSAKELGITA